MSEQIPDEIFYVGVLLHFYSEAIISFEIVSVICMKTVEVVFYFSHKAWARASWITARSSGPSNVRDDPELPLLNREYIGAFGGSGTNNLSLFQHLAVSLWRLVCHQVVLLRW